MSIGEFLALICAIIAGVCLMVILMRKKLPLIGTILSPKIKEELDSTDKKLALTALFFFLLSFIFIILFMT